METQFKECNKMNFLKKQNPIKNRRSSPHLYSSRVNRANESHDLPTFQNKLKICTSFSLDTNLSDTVDYRKPA